MGPGSTTLGGRRPVAETDRRLSRPDYLIGDGEDELHALSELALKLDAIRRADRLAAIQERARLAFIAGAEEESQRSHRRGLTARQLEAVLARFS